MSSAVEARLAALEARMSAAEARLNSGGSAGNANTNGAGKSIASDSVLDGQWGDTIVIKSDPKRWIENGGESFVGCRLSECPSDYLEEIAKLYDWQADQDEKKDKRYKNKKGDMVPTAPLKRSDAAKARGWARRNKNRTQAAPALPPASQQHDAGGSEQGFGDVGGDDSDIPFCLNATIHGRWDRP